MECNLKTQAQKLIKLNRKAEKAITREKATKILRKYEKARIVTQDPRRCHNSPV
tara:strand:+ start:147 stop:308 length:162 start_codon:yes stop_codon:yes gene_type:complete